MRLYVAKILLAFVFFPVSVHAQSLSVNATQETASNGPSAFTLESGTVQISDAAIRFDASGTTAQGFNAFSIAPDRSFIGTLEKGTESEVTIWSSEGEQLLKYPTLELASDDPSLGIYAVSGGKVMVRDNIARFNLYDTFGESVATITSSTQSQEGEAISELATDPRSKTTVIYNPQIKQNGTLGSRAQVLNGEELKEVYASSDRIIEDVTVSNDGQFILLLTRAEGTADEILLMDRYGNEITSISTDEEVEGFDLSADAQFVTLFSSSRAIVFSSSEGERVGSTSLRSPIVQATFIPDNQIILALTGDQSGNTISGVEFHAISLEQQAIARQELGGSLSTAAGFPLRFVENGPREYILKGANKDVVLQPSF